MRFKTIYTTFAFLFLGYLFLSSSIGRDDNRANAPGDLGYCSACHSAGTGGNVALTGVPGSYTAGTTYPLTLTITDSDAIVGGFQIVATDGSSNTQVGTFSAAAGSTRINPNNRLVHSTPQAFAGMATSWTFNWTAPASGGPATVEFFYAGNATNNNGNTGGDEAYFNSTTTTMPLPVELSQFDVTAMNDSKVKLTWQTRSEINSDYFEIQRSHVHNDNVFENIGVIRAAGNATWTIDYSFMDETPTFNQQSYYRLKQVDKDGSFEYSPIQSVKVLNEDVAFKVFPNPVRKGESITINFSNDNILKEKIEVVNMQGQLVWENKIINKNASSLAFVLPDLPTGQYHIIIQGNGQRVEAEKLFIVD